MRRILLTTSIFLALFIIHNLFFKNEAVAAGEFSISYDNIYEVDNNLSFNVTQNVKITNLTTEFYAAEFAISIGNIKVENVKASDESGPLQTTLDFGDSQTQIKFKFSPPVIGKGQIKKFTLSYQASELVNKAGQILEVSIPKLSTSTDIGEFNVILIVPASLGPTAFVSPEPKSFQIGGFGGKSQYFFQKEQLLQSGISAAFGEKQVFSFSLIYHLFNPKSVQTEIALPPDNPYQKVIISKIDPPPKNVRLDSDGNWMALYKLQGGKQKDVKVSGFVEIYPKPKFKIYQDSDLQKYLQPQQYWEVDNDYFNQKAKELKNPKQIYDFVTTFLSYSQERLNLSKIERLGAANAVKTPKNAVCMEFTDLFITLARAAGIPAREVNGFAVSSNERLRPLSLRNLGGDILHAWPEYWDEKLQTWVQIDPTWGTTSGGLDYFSKMDFVHIAFVHKGQSSTYPAPAGAYKIDQTKAGDVKVEFAKNLPTTTFEPRLSINLPEFLFSGFASKGEITVRNFSNQAINPGVLKLKTSNLILTSPAEIDIGILPPQAVREIQIEVDSNGLLTNKIGEVQVSLDSQIAVSRVQIRSSLFFGLLVVLSGLIILTVLVVGSVFIIKRVKFVKFYKTPRI